MEAAKFNDFYNNIPVVVPVIQCNYAKWTEVSKKLYLSGSNIIIYTLIFLREGVAEEPALVCISLTCLSISLLITECLLSPPPSSSEPATGHEVLFRWPLVHVGGALSFTATPVLQHS